MNNLLCDLKSYPITGQSQLIIIKNAENLTNIDRLENYFLLLILILCFPLFTIYQKYLDPLFYLFFFGLINSIYLKEVIIKSEISLLLIYGYFLFFLAFSIFYYSIGF